MGLWAEARHRLISITIAPSVARAATGAPGGLLPIEPELHVGCGYQVLLPDGRIVHEAGLTLHGQGEALPDDLAAAVESLRQHAAQRIAERESLPPG